MTPQPLMAALVAVVAALIFIVLSADRVESTQASGSDEIGLDSPSSLEAPLADDSSDCGAAALTGTELAAGGTCGGNTCRKGTYCCNASCGNCVPLGMSCTQQSCN